MGHKYIPWLVFPSRLPNPKKKKKTLQTEKPYLYPQKLLTALSHREGDPTLMAEIGSVLYMASEQGHFEIPTCPWVPRVKEEPLSLT